MPSPDPIQQIVLCRVSRVHSPAYIRNCYYPQLNFAITEFSEVRHSPGPTPRSVPDSELSRDRRPPRKAAVPFARAPSPCSRGQAFPCGSKHPPARCSSLCRSLRYRCGGMRKPCGEVALRYITLPCIVLLCTLELEFVSAARGVKSWRSTRT